MQGFPTLISRNPWPCGADGHLPLYYDVYEGNRHDAQEFPLMLRRFEGFFKQLSSRRAPQTTLIFDKGNNGAGNFSLLDSMGLNYVGSVKLNEHKDPADLARLPIVSLKRAA